METKRRLTSFRLMCHCCKSLCHWLTGLTLLVIGGVQLLIQVGALDQEVWSWTWPIILLIWGVAVMYYCSCRECRK